MRDSAGRIRFAQRLAARTLVVLAVILLAFGQRPDWATYGSVDSWPLTNAPAALRALFYSLVAVSITLALVSSVATGRVRAFVAAIGAGFVLGALVVTPNLVQSSASGLPASEIGFGPGARVTAVGLIFLLVALAITPLAIGGRSATGPRPAGGRSPGTAIRPAVPQDMDTPQS